MSTRLALAALLALAAAPAPAAVIQVYGPTDAASTDGSLFAAIQPRASDGAFARAQVKIRPNLGNWNMSLDNGKGTEGTGAAATFLGTNLSPAPNANTSNPYYFTERFYAGQGFVYTLQQAQITAGTPSIVDAATTYVQCWGGGFGANCPSGTGYNTRTAATLNGEAPTGSFNAIHIEARSNNTNTPSANATSWYNLTYDIPGFTALSATSFVPTGSVTRATSAGTDGYSHQWLVADTDLSTINWSISGYVMLNPASNNENYKFTVSVKNLATSTPPQNSTAVPEPASLALLGAGLAALAWRRAQPSVRRTASRQIA